jgi:hypothetical protein
LFCQGSVEKTIESVVIRLSDKQSWTFLYKNIVEELQDKKGTLMKMLADPLLRLLGSRFEYITRIGLLLRRAKFITSIALAAVK